MYASSEECWKSTAQLITRKTQFEISFHENGDGRQVHIL